MKTRKAFIIAVFSFIITFSAFAQDAIKDLATLNDLLNNGKGGEEIEVLVNKLLLKYPDDARVFREATSLLLSKYGSFDKMWTELAKIYPNNNIALSAYTYVLIGERKYDEALKNAERLTTVQPDSAIYWMLKGEVFESMKKFDQALNSFTQATLLDADNISALENQARVFVKLNRFDEAISSYTRAIDLNSSHQALHLYFRGSAYCHKGDKVNALNDLEKALNMQPSYKSRSVRDGFYGELYQDEDFKKITEGAELMKRP